MLARFAREGDFDAFLLAGRYTLLDQDALPELLPLCMTRGIAVLVGGVMNSGVLADPRPGASFDYGPASPEVIARARGLAAACERHGVPLACRRDAVPAGPSRRWPGSSRASGRSSISTSTRRSCGGRSRRPCGTTCGTPG